MEASYQNNIPKVLKVFSFALLVVLVGLFVGQFVPPALLLPIIIAEIAMIIAMVFLRKKKAVGYGMMYTFMLLSGITLYASLSYYVSTLGADLVLKAFLVTVVAFGTCAVFASSKKRDFSFLGTFLFAGLIALLFTGIVSIFFPFGNTMELIYSAFGVLIFIGYTLYDFNRMARHGISDDEIPITVVSIYLDFVNLFLFALRLIGVLSRD